MPVVPKLIPPGTPTKIGSISALNTPLYFSLPERTEGVAGRAVIVAESGAVSTPTWELDASIDGGTSWFAVALTTFTLTGTLTGDTAAIYAASFPTAGLVKAIFGFGLTAGTGITAMPIYVQAN